MNAVLTRRRTIGGGIALLTLGGTCACADAAGREYSAGCLIGDAHFEAITRENESSGFFPRGNEPMFPKSGDPNFDYAIAQTLAKLSAEFQVLPSFAYYRDDAGQNAYATSRARLSRSDGTVLMGSGLLRTLRKGKEHPAVAVAAVCAHEFGHILQFKLGLIDKVNAGQKTVRRSELHRSVAGAGTSTPRTNDRPLNRRVIRYIDFERSGGPHSRASDLQRHRWWPEAPSPSSSATVKSSRSLLDCFSVRVHTMPCRISTVH